MDRLHEFFIRYSPGDGAGREIPPFFIGPEAGRAIRTPGNGKKIFVQQPVIDASEERSQRMYGGTGGGSDAGANTQVVRTVAVGGQRRGDGVGQAVLPFLVGLTHYDMDRMYPERPVIA